MCPDSANHEKYASFAQMNPITTKNQERPKKHKGLHMQGTIWAALYFFGMDESHTTKGLRYLKDEARSRFRAYAKRYHPDRNNCHAGHHTPCNGCGLRNAIRHYNVLRKLTIMPITANNAMAVLEITKGYVTTADAEVP